MKLILAAALAALLVGCARDDSDSLDERSGMTPLIDAKTGCEYLGYGGGITPRMDNTGHQVCTKG